MKEKEEELAVAKDIFFRKIFHEVSQAFNPSLHSTISPPDLPVGIH